MLLLFKQFYMLHVHWIIYINGFDLLVKVFGYQMPNFQLHISTSLKNSWVQKTDYHSRFNYAQVKFRGEFHVIIYWSLWTFCNKCQNLQVIPLVTVLVTRVFSWFEMSHNVVKSFSKEHTYSYNCSCKIWLQSFYYSKS